MVFTLSDNTKVRYSKKERVIFDALPQNGSRISSRDLVEKVYGDAQPFHGRTTVVGFARSLMRKIDFNKEPFRLAKSEPAGPTPIEYWLEPR